MKNATTTDGLTSATDHCNETVSAGIVAEAGGTFLAMTLSASKSLKTRAGAVRWLAARGYRADGSKAAS